MLPNSPTINFLCLFGWLLQLLLVTGLNRDLGVSDEWFAMGDSLVLTVLGQVMLWISSLFDELSLDFMISYML